MFSESRLGVRLQLLCLCLLLVLFTSCGSKDQVIGTYKAEAGDSPRQAEIVIELKANGAGIWRVSDEEITFAWDLKGKELRVYTKGGGVIVGAVENDTIRISLPGTKIMSFKRFN